MDFHLDRQLRLKSTSEIEHPKLYSEAVIEVDERGRQVGRDMIPWRWSLSFRAIDIAVIHSVRFESKDYRGRDTDSSMTHQSVIRCQMQPGRMRQERGGGHEPTYRFFGTDRVITDFRLDIMAETPDLPAGCVTWGSVSYTSEVDFRTLTTSDTVQWTLFVPGDLYDRYVWNVGQNLADEVHLSIGMVDGFYSEWSPAVSTDEIKVLAGDEHVVQGAEHLQLPRLGAVGKAELYMTAGRDLRRQVTESAGRTADASPAAYSAEPNGASRSGFRWPGSR